MSQTTAKIAAGVAGGYLLGRTKKLRLALMLGGLLAGKKLAADPKAIADRVVKANPELGHLRGQLTDGLTGAAKDLALATAASRMELVTKALQAPVGDASATAKSAAKKAPAKKAPAKKAPAKKAAAKAPAKRTAAKKAPAKRTAAKKAPAKKASATKKAPAKKTTSRTRTTKKSSSGSGR